MSSYPHNTEGYTINSPSEKVKDAVKNVLERVIQEESQRKEKEQEETKKILDARKKKDDESAKHVRLFFEQKGMSPDYIDQVLKLPQKEDEYSSDPRQTHRSNFTSKKTRFSILSWDPTESESVRSVSPTSTSSSSSTTASNSNASIHSSNTSVSLGPQDASETLETSPMLSVDNVFQSFWIQSYLLKPLVKATQVLPKGLGLKSTIDSWNLKYQDMGSDIILHKTLSLQEMNTIIEETFEKTSTVVSKFIICADALDESDLCYSEMSMDFIVHEKLEHDTLVKLILRTKELAPCLQLPKDSCDVKLLKEFLINAYIPFTETNYCFQLHQTITSASQMRRLGALIDSKRGRFNFLVPNLLDSSIMTHIQKVSSKLIDLSTGPYELLALPSCLEPTRILREHVCRNMVQTSQEVELFQMEDETWNVQDYVELFTIKEREREGSSCVKRAQESDSWAETHSITQQFESDSVDTEDSWIDIDLNSRLRSKQTTEPSNLSTSSARPRTRIPAASSPLPSRSYHDASGGRIHQSPVPSRVMDPEAETRSLFERGSHNITNASHPIPTKTWTPSNLLEDLQDRNIRRRDRGPGLPMVEKELQDVSAAPLPPPPLLLPLPPLPPLPPNKPSVTSDMDIVLKNIPGLVHEKGQNSGNGQLIPSLEALQRRLFYTEEPATRYGQPENELSTVDVTIKVLPFLQAVGEEVLRLGKIQHTEETTSLIRKNLRTDEKIKELDAKLQKRNSETFKWHHLVEGEKRKGKYWFKQHEKLKESSAQRSNEVDTERFQLMKSNEDLRHKMAELESRISCQTALKTENENLKRQIGSQIQLGERIEALQKSNWKLERENYYLYNGIDPQSVDQGPYGQYEPLNDRQAPERIQEILSTQCSDIGDAKEDESTSSYQPRLDDSEIDEEEPKESSISIAKEKLEEPSLSIVDQQSQATSSEHFQSEGLRMRKKSWPLESKDTKHTQDEADTGGEEKRKQKDIELKNSRGEPSRIRSALLSMLPSKGEATSAGPKNPSIKGKEPEFTPSDETPSVQLPLKSLEPELQLVKRTKTVSFNKENGVFHRGRTRVRQDNRSKRVSGYYTQRGMARSPESRSQSRDYEERALVLRGVRSRSSSPETRAMVLATNIPRPVQRRSRAYYPTPATDLPNVNRLEPFKKTSHEVSENAFFVSVLLIKDSSKAGGGKYEVRRLILDKTEGDAKVFQKIKDEYYRRRGWYRRFSLKGVTDIQFANYYEPASTEPENYITLPFSRRHELAVRTIDSPTSNADEACESHLLRHFKKPKTASNSIIWVEAFCKLQASEPKIIEIQGPNHPVMKVFYAPPLDLSQGQGIMIKESWLKMRILKVMASAVVLSVVFGVAWGCATTTEQGLAAAGYIFTVCMVLLSLVSIFSQLDQAT